MNGFVGCSTDSRKEPYFCRIRGLARIEEVIQKLFFVWGDRGCQERCTRERIRCTAT